MRSIRTEIAFMSFNEEESLLHIEITAGAEMTLENTSRHYRVIHELTSGKPYIALVNAANYFMIDPDALKYGALQNTIANRVASAHYNSNVANVLTVSFFKNNHKPGIPVGIFKTKEEALEWITTLKKEGIFNLSKELI
ncbi:MAG: hypothetical protein H0W61_03230 [Bacteroidetes bacterium]|nr:hypothetical protein [Bacteroidota bacterium]